MLQSRLPAAVVTAGQQSQSPSSNRANYFSRAREPGASFGLALSQRKCNANELFTFFLPVRSRATRALVFSFFTTGAQSSQ